MTLVLHELAPPRSSSWLGDRSIMVLDRVPGQAASGRHQGPDTSARLASLAAPGTSEELEWAFCVGAEGVLAFGVVGRHDIERLGARLAVLEAEHGLADGAMRILAVVADTPAGILALSSLRPSARLVGVACDPAGLAAALGCVVTAPAVTQARALTVLAAASCRVPAIAIALSATKGALAAAGREGFAAVLAPPPAPVTVARVAASRSASPGSRRSSRGSRPA